MRTSITKLDIQNEMDLVLAHRRAMQIAKFAGINISDQTRFATAVSEMCRNAIQHCGNGEIEFLMKQAQENKYDIEAAITDNGRGIRDLDTILKRNPQTHKGKGTGIVFSRKLVDFFKITSNDKGTRVLLGLQVPGNGTPINNLIIQGWINHIKKEPPLNAYEELKIRNANLLQLTDELRNEKENVEKHLRQIENLNNKLQKTNSYMEEFTYTVSHDLKTPLTSIKLSLNLLDESQDAESKLVYMEIIGRAAKRLEKTVQGLVTILEVQRQNQSMAKVINMDEFFVDMNGQFELQIVNKDVTIENSFMVTDICFIEPYLTSIFTNLIGNSIKYRIAEKPLQISISTRRKNGMVLLTFTDNAEGIDLAKNRSRLFTPFTRFSSQQEGKGIGLYIIKKMVERNDGYIEVDSEPGVGTTFRIYLKEYALPAVS